MENLQIDTGQHGIGKYDVLKVKTWNRRVVSQVKKHKSKSHFFPDHCPTEIDNHADTNVFGKNFRPIYFTSEVCKVSPFLSEYGEQDNIPICTAVTAYDTEDGETVLLEFGQGLWFGDRMDRSLINPNQSRHYGIGICDDPTDRHRSLGIEVSDDMFVPMSMSGTTCGLSTRCPTDAELEPGICRRSLLSDEHHWDPNDVTFRVASVVRGKAIGARNISKLSRQIRITDGEPCKYEEDLHISEFDRQCLESSGSLAQDVMVDRLIGSVQVDATYSDKRHHGANPELLARKWGIGLQKAKETLACTTQLNIRSAILPLTRRYRTDLVSQRLRRLSCRFFTDTAFEKNKSARGNIGIQIFTDGEGFIQSYPVRSKAEAGDALQQICEDVGVPNKLHMDNAPEMVGKDSKFMEIVRLQKIQTSSIESKSPWQNKCETIIGVIGKKAKNRRIRRRVPKPYWDYGYVWECQIYSRTANKDGRTGLEKITGDTPEISDWLEFEFYDLVRYWDNREDEEKDNVGRWLGVAHRIGSALCYWILTEKGTVISRTTVQHFTEDEVKHPELQERIRDYHRILEASLGANYVFDDQDDNAFVLDDVDAPIGSGYNESDYFGPEQLPDVDDVVKDEDERAAENTYDQYVGAEISVPDRNGQKLLAKVMKRLENRNTNADGKYNPLKDHSIYEVQFGDGTTEELQANVIAESMLSDIDAEGKHYQLLTEIQDHKKDETAIPRSQGFYERKGGHKVPKRTTRGWQLLVEWKDGSVDWIPLVELKESYPVQLAEYAVANQIDDEPAFNWWAKKVLRRRDRIIAKVKSKYWRTSHKFGIRIPKTVEEAYRIDQENGNTFWTDAIAKEMRNVRVAFSIVEGVTPEEMRQGKVKPGYKFCGTHMIFDIKMDGKFTRKARLVADGHKTDAPASITYSSVVSRDSVRIAFMLASLNDLEVFSCDIGNAYLNANCREKLWTITGAEFGSEKGSVMIISRALLTNIFVGEK